MDSDEKDRLAIQRCKERWRQEEEKLQQRKKFLREKYKGCILRFTKKGPYIIHPDGSTTYVTIMLGWTFPEPLEDIFEKVERYERLVEREGKY